MDEVDDVDDGGDGGGGDLFAAAMGEHNIFKLYSKLYKNHATYGPYFEHP